MISGEEKVALSPTSARPKALLMVCITTRFGHWVTHSARLEFFFFFFGAKVNVGFVNNHDSAPTWMFKNLLNIGSGDQVPGWISRRSNVYVVL